MKSKNRIVIVFLGNYPHGMAMSKRLHLYAKSLIEQNIEPLIFTSDNINFSNSGICEYKEVKYIKNKEVKIKISLLKSLFRKYNIVIRYLKNPINTEHVWLIGHSWMLTLFFRIITYFQKRKLIVELNEYPYITYGDRRLNFKLISIINQFIEIKLIFPLLDGFVVISDALERKVKIWNKKAVVIKIPILIDFRNENKISNLKNRYHNLFLFHAGTLNEQKDGIIHIFQAYSEIQKKYPHLRFILTNKNTVPKTIEKIQRIIIENNLSNNVIFYNGLKNEEVEEYLISCTFAIINKPINKQNTYNFSTKLGEYLMFGVPLITTINGEANNYLRNRDCCYMIEENSIKQMVNSMDEILSNSELTQIKIRNGQKLAQEAFDYRNYSKSLASFINELKSQ